MKFDMANCHTKNFNDFVDACRITEENTTDARNYGGRQRVSDSPRGGSRGRKSYSNGHSNGNSNGNGYKNGHHKRSSSGSSHSNGYSNGHSSSHSNGHIYGNSNLYWPYGRTKFQREELKAERRCFVCLKPGHMANADDAPCKGQKPTKMTENVLAYDTGQKAPHPKPRVDDYPESSDSEN
ncbi:hypothetical protein P152DRAFT_35130 [Eremomyces bilateralis CBS 781.70]|uniref:Uncharacterized protein n=1 Tax=Eremomyces bilateralis CBS 781.70 TaxID=1392243 RepID=A0A6G1G2T8_9PEZI|nr:uncharacterized protein P152DRAFT_35130 [Eremomyces bilateralis CBS 781.70]KAF1812425.1 hypothetical protein P152DRAFT_35130 [Eremomyces bilateralis CBS 781.70]